MQAAATPFYLTSKKGDGLILFNNNLGHLPHLLALMVPVPLFVAFLALRILGERAGKIRYPLTIAAAAFSFTMSVLILVGVLIFGSSDWTLSFPAGIPLGFDIDRLTAVMLLLVTGVSLVVHSYSLRYMDGEPHYDRFISGLSLSTASTLMLVMANNLFMLYLFWLLTGLSVIRLVSSRCAKAFSCRATRRMIVAYGIGDAAFGLGVFFAYFEFGTVSYQKLFHLAASAPTHPVILGHWLSIHGSTGQALAWITLLLFIGIMVRTAQFPFQSWLVDTLDAPTPVSALMHAGIVNIGGFLLARLSPLFVQSPHIMHGIFLVGILTAFYGTSVMLTQNDVKGTLVYSTIGQMGFMVMEAGLGAYAFVIFHLASHGIFKATLFLGSGKVERPVPAGQSRPLSWASWMLSLVFPALFFYALSRFGGAAPFELDGKQEPFLLLFAWATVTQAVAGVFRFSYSPKAWPAGTVVLGLVLTGYLFLVRWFHHFLSSAIAPVPEKIVWPDNYGAIYVMAAIVFLSGLVIKLPAFRASRQTFFLSWINASRKTLYVFAANRWYADEIGRWLCLVTISPPIRWLSHGKTLLVRIYYRFLGPRRAYLGDSQEEWD